MAYVHLGLKDSTVALSQYLTSTSELSTLCYYKQAQCMIVKGSELQIHQVLMFCFGILSQQP